MEDTQKKRVTRRKSSDIITNETELSPQDGPEAAPVQEVENHQGRGGQYIEIGGGIRIPA